MNASSRIPTPAQARALQEENAILREALRQAQEALTPPLAFPEAWRLSPIEGLLLRAIYAVAPRVLTRDRALSALYGFASDDVPDEGRLEVYLCRLRQKLRKADAAVRIRTLNRVGYQMDEDSRAWVAARFAEQLTPSKIAE